MKIRVKFGKEGNLKFIGHLDYMHFYQKALRRADIPICYSAGFSPHQIMSFASPLSVGHTSEGEYMDIEVSESGSSVEMLEKLNAHLVEGAKVYSWKLLPDDAENAMASIAAADYVVSFREGYGPVDWQQFTEEFAAFCEQDSILVEKQTKRRTMEVDIRPLIYRLEMLGNAVFLQVASGSVNHLKPEMVFQAFYDAKGEELSPFALMIHRKEIYADRGTDGDRKLVALEDLGEDIL